MPKSVIVVEDIRIPMRDGIRIMADLYKPDDSERHPVILYRNYDRRRYGTRYPVLIRDYIEAGYCVVVSEVRGRNGSEGAWKPDATGNQDGEDGYDMIEWLAEQPWSDSNIGMIGASHAAGFQYAAARLHPPHLKAIAPWTGGGMGRPSDGGGGFKPPLSGGVTAFMTTLIWIPNEAPDVVNRLEAEGHDVTEMRALLKEMRRAPESLYFHLPLMDHPIANMGRIGELFRWRVKGGPRKEVGFDQPWHLIEIPAYHECGWYDAVAWEEFNNFNSLRKGAGTPEAREAQYIICGPWQHGMYFQPLLGDIYFGPEAATEGSGVNQLTIRFFDKYLRGADVEVPRVRYFTMGLNEWRTANDWPLPQTNWTRYYLHSQGGANTADGDGVLSPEEPANEFPDTYIYDPHRPVPTTGGAMIGAVTGPGFLVGPIEQHRVESRHDVLCYTTPPFEQDTEITGPLQAHLTVSTSAVDTDFYAKLTHVYPDGQSYNLAEGILRLSGRNFDGVWADTKPGEPIEITITLGATSIVVREGFRLRLQVTSSNFPQFDRNMNTGNPVGTDAKGLAALQTVFHGEGRLSYIDLPIVP
jgi:putative CocE/NonD family hydrolase